jgi:iron-sulfur cluster repair protein YtfE (RIC family)
MDALALLKKDHDEVKKLLKDLDDTTDRAIKTRQHLFERLEHDVVDTILGELEQTPFDDETWHAKLTAMRENLLHHIQEEEDEMFGQVRRLFDKATLESLGEQMRTIKAQARAA